MSSDPLLPPGSEPEPSIPPQTVPPATTPPVLSAASAPTGSTGLAPNLAAGLAVLFGIIGGIVFFLVEKRDQFVRFWAMQSIFFGAAIFVLGIVGSVFLGIVSHISVILGFLFSLVFSVVWLGVLILWVIMLVQAFSSKEWELPILGKMAREQLAKLPPV